MTPFQDNYLNLAEGFSEVLRILDEAVNDPDEFYYFEMRERLLLNPLVCFDIVCLIESNNKEYTWDNVYMSIEKLNLMLDIEKAPLN